MASLGASSAALSVVAFPQPAPGTGSQPKQEPAETPPVNDVESRVRSSSVDEVQFQGLQLSASEQEAEESASVAALPTDDSQQTQEVTNEQEVAIAETLGQTLEEEQQVDPQEAFEEQAERISELVDRFEEFLRKLDEFVERVSGEEQPVLGPSTVRQSLAEGADEVLKALETTAAALFAEIEKESSSGNPEDQLAFAESLADSDSLNVIL